MTKIKNNVFKMAALGILVAACGVVGAVTYVSSARASAEETEEAVVHVCDETEYCLVCDVATQINALPTADEITLENAAAVTQQIHNIDRIRFDMTDEQFDEFRTLVEVENYGDVVRYDNAVAKLQSLQSYTQVAITKKFDLGGEPLQDTSETEIAFAIRNVDTNQTTEIMMFDLGCATSALGEEAYQITADGWTFSYAMPTGTYEITELNTAKPITVNGKDVYMDCQSMSFNGETVSGNGITVTLQENAYNVVFVENKGPEHEHSYGELVAEKPATCEEDGMAAHYFCEGCGSYFDEEQTPTTESYLLIPAAGHNYGERIDETLATCEEDGMAAHYFCEGCGSYFDEEQKTVEQEELKIEATGHDYSPWIETKEATTKEQGERKKVCLNCGNVVVEPTPKLEPLVKDRDLTAVFIVLGIVIVMGAVAYVVTKNDWTN